MIVLMWFINCGISLLNAWGCGKTWTETKANGGMPHFLNWCGVIMAAVGFTWCWMVIGGFLGATIPYEHEVHGRLVSAPLLDAKALEAFANLGYLVIVAPLLGSGLAITVHSWWSFAQRRSLSGGITVGWNSFAMIENVYDAAVYVPKAASGLGSFFKDSDDKGKSVVLFLVVFALLAGILTTYTIVTAVARSTARERLAQAMAR